MATAYLLITVLIFLVGSGLGYDGSRRVQEQETGDTPTNFDNVLVKEELKSPADLKLLGSADRRKGCSQTKKCTNSGGTNQAKGSCSGMAWKYSRNCECCLPDQLEGNGLSDISSFNADLLETPLPSDFSSCMTATGNTSEDFIIQVFREGIWEGYVTPQKDDNGNVFYVMADSHSSASYATFEPVDGIWGYIKFVNNKNNQVMRPDNTGEGAWIAPSNTKDRWSQFAINQVTHQISHRSGRVLELDGNHLSNGGGTYMETHLVDTCGSDKQVLAYGNATVDAEWELIFAVDHPLASQTYVVHSTVGKSSSQSTNTNFKFVWEATFTARYWFYSFSRTAKLEYEISKSSTQTWNEQIEETDTYNVKIGEPVAVWQKVFYGYQIGNRAVFDSNIFCHTNSSDTHPNEIDACKYHGPSTA
ncbi:unnamed protein product [Meganyctiphanes norvegica]|uniref:Uncharacterized protein n=1 Tax=Meganyctiphanes norvegica TaxID=48144 RepID=A0AAV2RAP9_MEGNR